jgi:hypothetical protein
MRDPSDALTTQLLSWLAEKPRSYGETMDAWKTSCPRLPIWEDAVVERLVEVRGGASMRGASVVLTDQGRARLADAQTR